MTVLPLLLAFGVQQQQQPRRAPAELSGPAAYDTSFAAINQVGFAGAYVKSALDLLRRAVFNSPDAEVLSAAGNLRAKCRELDSTATGVPRRICRHCGSPQVRSALQRYRASLPSLARVGGRCASRVAVLSRGSGAAARIKREFFTLSNPIIEGLRADERHYPDVEIAMQGGVAPPPAVPLRRPRPAGP